MKEKAFERGPNGQIHVPEFSKGCYYERTEDCCILCYLRITASYFRILGSSLTQGEEAEADSVHVSDDLIGTRVEVPAPGQTQTDRTSYVEATVVDVNPTDETLPDIVTVRMKTGEEFDIVSSEIRRIE